MALFIYYYLNCDGFDLSHAAPSAPLRLKNVLRAVKSAKIRVTINVIK